MRIRSLALAALLVACSSSGSAPPSNTGGSGGTASAGSGGQTGGGAGTSTGGAPATGGSASTGGTTATGGTTSTAPGTGGGTGGTTATGGTPSGGGGSAGTGGAGTGDTVASGGTTRADAGTGGSGTGGTGTSLPDGAADARDAVPADRPPEVPAPDTRDAIADSPADAGTPPLTVYIAGDSTVSTYTNSSIHQAGWGQFLQDYFIANAKIVNKAVGGMTARHFIEAGYLDDIIASIKAGDYLLVQFGTNDGNKTATYTLPGSSTEIPYYLDPQTDFKTYLSKYVDATKAKRATTLFVTPPPRHSCNAGETGVRNGLSAYADAMKQLGPTLATPVVDLNAMVIAYLANITCETSGSTFYLVKADGTIDSTHFQEKGANVMAGLIAKGTSGIVTLDVPLAAYVK